MHCEHFKLFLLHWHHFHVSTTWRGGELSQVQASWISITASRLLARCLSWRLVLMEINKKQRDSKDGPDVRIGWMFDQIFASSELDPVTTLRKERR